jgi:hypothetical protein
MKKIPLLFVMLLPLTLVAQNDTIRILFTGNSLTYQNGGIDIIFENLTENMDTLFICTAATIGGSTLFSRWGGFIQDSVENGNHDYVVVQEFSIQPYVNQDDYYKWAYKWDTLVRNYNGEPIHWMNWPRDAAFDTYMEAIDSITTKLGEDFGSLVAPCGLAFNSVFTQYPSDTGFLYKDEVHETYDGSYLCACIFYATITGKSPIGLPALESDSAAYLQKVAWEVYQNYTLSDTTSNITVKEPIAGQSVDFSLQQNYPNPFNLSTTIQYQVFNTSRVELAIHNAMGKKIATLVNKTQLPGLYTLEFNPSGLSSGIYYCIFRTGCCQEVRKMLLLK